MEREKKEKKKKKKRWPLLALLLLALPPPQSFLPPPSLLQGKCSIVRQLEPGLHIDGAPSTVADLGRFVPNLLLCGPVPPPRPPPQGTLATLSGAPTLESFFATAAAPAAA